MTFFSHSVYRLRAARERHANATWLVVGSPTFITVQIGERFGMIVEKFQCDCCEGFVYCNFFFTTDDDDDVLTKLMQPTTSANGTTLYIYLANGMRGRFELVSTTKDFHDASILRTVVCANERDPSEFTLNCFFKKIQTVVAVRAAFCRLRTYARRSSTEPNRMLILRVFRRQNVTEQGLHLKILRLSRLW